MLFGVPFGIDASFLPFDLMTLALAGDHRERGSSYLQSLFSETRHVRTDANPVSVSVTSTGAAAGFPTPHGASHREHGRR